MNAKKHSDTYLEFRRKITCAIIKERLKCRHQE